MRRFRPDVIVTMTGVDPHHTDPMAHLQVTTSAFPRLNAAMRDLAFDAAQGRWLVVTGGGYNIDLLARLWAMLLAQMVERGPARGDPGRLARDRARARRPRFHARALGRHPPRGGRAEIAQADAQAFETIAAARELHGLR